MKIAIITSGFLPVVDGVTVADFNRMKKLSQWGHQVRVFCPDYSSLASVYPNWQDYTGEILPNIEVVNLPSDAFMGLDFERNVSWRARPYLMQSLEEFQPDILHVDEPERLSVGLLQTPASIMLSKLASPVFAFTARILLSMQRTISTGLPLPFPASRMYLSYCCDGCITLTIRPLPPVQLHKRKLSSWGLKTAGMQG